MASYEEVSSTKLQRFRLGSGGGGEGVVGRDGAGLGVTSTKVPGVGGGRGGGGGGVVRRDRAGFDDDVRI